MDSFNLNSTNLVLTEENHLWILVFLLKDTLAVSQIKPLTFQFQESRPISRHKPTLLSQFLSTMSEMGKCQQKDVNPLLTWVLSEDTVIPLVVDVQVELLCRCRSSTTQPWQSRQIGGQLSGLATQETRREVKLNWLTRERSPPFRQSPAPPFNELEVPPAACSAVRG